VALASVGYNEKPWKHLLKIKDQQDRQLFFFSTIMWVENEKIHISGNLNGLMATLLKTLLPNSTR
jgi:hypothetical protein